jgi:uncharacterized protein YcfL
MKQIYPILLSLLLLSSCKPDKTPAASSNIPVESINSSRAATIDSIVLNTADQQPSDTAIIEEKEPAPA